jgi:HEAT repeat protein
VTDYNEIIIDRILEVFANEPNHVAEGYVQIVSSFGEAAVLPLIEALKSPNPNLRSYSASALGEIGDQRAKEPLLNLLSDDDYDTRLAASYALVELDSVESSALIQLFSDDDWRIRSSAVFIAGKLQKQDLVLEIVRLLKDGYETVRYQAAYALEQINSEQAITALEESLNDESSYVTANAASALAKIRK